MKRAWMKKVKAVPTNAEKDAMREQFKPVQPRMRRRLRTSVAMLGLAISIGGPSLLLTRQDRAPAAEKPQSNEPTTNTVTATPVTSSQETSTVVAATVAAPTTSVVPTTPLPESSIVPAVPLAPPTVVRESQQQPQSVTQTSATKRTAAKTTASEQHTTNAIRVDASYAQPQTVISNQPTPPSRTQLQQRLVQKLKTANNVQSQKSVESTLTNTDTNTFSTKQKLLVNRLKQPSNLQNAAKLRLEEPQLSTREVQPSLTSPIVDKLQPQASTPSNQQAIALITSNNQQQPSPITAVTVPHPQQNVAPNQQLRNRLLESQPLGANHPMRIDAQVPTLSPTPLFNASPSEVGTPVRIAPSIVVEAQPLEKIRNSNNDVVVETRESLSTPSIVAIPSPQQVPSLNQSIETPLATATAPEQLAPVAPTPSTPVEFGFAQLDDITPMSDETPAPAVQPQQPESGESVASNNSATVETTDPVYVISEVTSGNNVQIGIAASAINYQVKRGDTLTAIARQHKVSLFELVSTNQISNPDKLEVDQSLVIPTQEYNNFVAAGQTIVALNRPPQQNPQTATATSEVADSIPVIPAVSSTANNTLSTVESSNYQGAVTTEFVAHNNKSPASLSGIGGSFSNEEPLDPPSFYVQGLQADIQRLRQKYNEQTNTQTTAPIAAATPVARTKSASTVNRSSPRQKTANEPVNSEFRVAQVSRGEKNTTIKAQLATAPTYVDPTEALQSLRGRQVSPELPPLGAIDIYLPKPNSAPFKGYIWPAKGALTSGYGWRWGRMHRGIDVAAPVGTPIVAAASGVVVRAGWNSGGYGKLVDIRHPDGSLTRYAHNNRILVRPGQQVEQGKQIAEMGSTGFSTGPHLHFEVHASGKAINPIAMLPRR